MSPFNPKVVVGSCKNDDNVMWKMNKVYFEKVLKHLSKMLFMGTLCFKF